MITTITMKIIQSSVNWNEHKESLKRKGTELNLPGAKDNYF